MFLLLFISHSLQHKDISKSQSVKKSYFPYYLYLRAEVAQSNVGGYELYVLCLIPSRGRDISLLLRKKGLCQCKLYLIEALLAKHQTFPLAITFRLVLKPTQPLAQWVLRDTSIGIKQLKHNADGTPPCMPCVHHHGVGSAQHKGICTLYFQVMMQASLSVYLCRYMQLLFVSFICQSDFVTCQTQILEYKAIILKLQHVQPVYFTSLWMIKYSERL